MANAWKADPTRKRKQWTVMIYFAGDNNLSEEMIYAIKEMYRVGVTEDVDVIVQFDPSAIGSPVRRYVISREQLTKDLEKPTIATASIRRQVEITSVNYSDEKKYPQVAAAIPKAIAASVPNSLGRLRCRTRGGNPIEVSNRIRITDADVDAKAREQRSDASSTLPRYRSRDAIGLDIDGSIIEELAIPLPEEKGQTATPNLSEKPVVKGKDEGIETAGPLPVRKPLPRLDFENSADPKVLEQFIRQSIDYFPSHHYMVVLSGHGSGALGDFLADTNPDTGAQIQSLSIPSLRRVFEEIGENIDILGMDSCLMSMAEIGYELKGHVDYLVGSEGFVLNTGWPYHRILEALNLNPAAPPLNLARETVKKYISYYDDYEAAGASTDQSVCELARLEALIPRIANLAEALIKGLEHDLLRDEIVLAHWEAQSYKAEQYTDLYDFCDRLQRRCIEQFPGGGTLQGAKDDNEILEKLPLAFPKETVKVSEALQAAIKLIETSAEAKKAIRRVVQLSCYTGPAFQYSHGLSVYFPWIKSDDLDAYENLIFAQESNWGKFLNKYVDKTRRPERTQHAGQKRIGHFNPNPNNEIVETLLLVRAGTSGNPKGPSSIGSTKNPPTDWQRGKCG